jgi:uncharacterized protein YkwD
MRNFIGLGTILVVVLFLGGCGGSAKPPAPPASATPPPPQSFTQVLATSAEPAFTPTSESTSPQYAPTSTPAAVEPASTSTLLSPTQTPTTESPAPSPTVFPTKPAPSIPTDTPTTAPSSGLGAACEDKAAFYSDVTVPDNSVFQQSVEFVKTWQIKNAGTCSWEGYSLVFGGGSSMDAPLSAPIPSVQPGDLVEISVKLKSPNQGGVYTSLWEFQNKAGKRFGVNSGGIDFIWAKIAVSTIPEGSDLPGSQPLPGPATCQTQQDADIVNQILVLLNKARVDNNLSPLTLQPQLSEAALGHSQDMACKNYVDHTGSDGSSWYDRIKAQGYSYRYANENIFYGDPAFGGGAQDAFDWWMKSKIHHDNMLSPKVTEIGIGYAYYPNSTYKGYYTLNFGKR